MVKKPISKVAGCDTCMYRSGEIFKDDTPDETKRVYCKARYANVDVVVMNQFCDFFEVKKED